jgi:chromosome segregation ATPase
MSYLLPQLWLCLSIASLLGGLIGWFLRGDNRKKLTQIENRWQKRFSDLEYNNQFLLNQLKKSKTIEKNNKTLIAQLERMRKAAELSNQQLKSKSILLSNLEKKMDQSNHSAMNVKDKKKHSKHPGGKDTEEQKDDLKHLEQSQLDKSEKEKARLTKQIDQYKAELIDTKSKLQVTNEMLDKIRTDQGDM